MSTTTPHTQTAYKDTPIGKIPADWEVKKLGEVVKLSSGKTKPILNNGMGQYPVFGGNGIMGYSESYNYTGETVIIGRVGEYCGITRYVDEPCWITDNALYAKEIAEGVKPIYLAYKLQQLNLSRYRSKGGQPLISQTMINPISLPLPPLSEQKRIAEVLSTWDQAIQLTEQLIRQKEQRKKWLMQQLLTGKKRLKGFSGEWKKIGAGEVFKSVTKKGYADEELLSATQDKGMIPRTMLEGRVTMPTTGTEGFKLVEVGDFVISLRSFQGGLEYSYYRGLVSPAYTVLKPKKPISEEFYKQYFKSYDFIGHLAIAVIGIRDGKQISYDDFCTVKIPYPTIEEQTAIAQVLQAADKEISLLKVKAEKLREQKKGLMQQLLTGRVRLKINNE